MIFFQRFYLDREKDILVDLYLQEDRMFYVIRTPNHHSGNLIRNMAKLFSLETEKDENGLLTIRSEVPCYVDGYNRKMYILRLGNTKVANIFPDGRVEVKASVPAISKTLMSQTKDYRLSEVKTIVKTYIKSVHKFSADLHTHMNGILAPDVLMALALVRQLRYPYYYIKKLGLRCTEDQIRRLEADRKETEKNLADLPPEGKHRDRRIDDNTFINFADLILGNAAEAEYNLGRIRNSLTIPKDGQAVFADLEKVYLYRYVFTKGEASGSQFSGINVRQIPDPDVREAAEAVLRDREDDRYRRNTLFQDLLLWIARTYRRHGIFYTEISDTALLKPGEFPDRLRQIHEIMPAVTRETGVRIRFLAGIRRTPLTIIRDRATPVDYLAENLKCLRVIAEDPYVAGSDIIGEEINDILELRGMIRELVRIAGDHPGFVIRIHAGENDSLPDNVANSLMCVESALRPGQAFPPLRIGHGLYTCDLKSAKGKKLLADLRKNGVTLEFQLTSNVRLNNLSTMERHPLRQYLRAGVSCVQGTDGSALYGTNSIDEELSLEKLLGLSDHELLRMKESEDRILRESLRVFEEKEAAFRAEAGQGDIAQYYLRKLEAATEQSEGLWKDSGKIPTAEALAGQITALPEGKLAVIIAGGSFNNSQHRTQVRPEDTALIDEMIRRADPEKVCFVVGHTLKGQEGYTVRKAAGRFDVIALVPNQVTRAERKRLSEAGVGILVSIESSGMGLYKSFAYEIFKRRPSLVAAFDGNSAAFNLIQEARNGQVPARIFINPRSRGLSVKARALEGYVRPIHEILRDWPPEEAEQPGKKN